MDRGNNGMNGKVWELHTSHFAGKSEKGQREDESYCGSHKTVGGDWWIL